MCVLYADCVCECVTDDLFVVERKKKKRIRSDANDVVQVPWMKHKGALLQCGFSQAAAICPQETSGK